MDQREALRDTSEPMGGPAGGVRTFEVVAWLAERRLVLYVPEIEAATSLVARIVGGTPFDAAGAEADAAARSLIADLTGLDPDRIRCTIRLRPGRGGPDGPLRLS